MGIIDRAQRIEDRFFQWLTADESRLTKHALITWIAMLLATIANVVLGIVTGKWWFLLPAGGFAVATALGIRTWWQLRGGSDA